MSMATGWNSYLIRFRKSGPQGRVGSVAIVVGYEFTKDALQMSLVQRNQVVQALAPNGANQPLAISIRHWASNRCLQHFLAEAVQCRINLGRENTVTVVNEIAMARFALLIESLLPPQEQISRRSRQLGIETARE